MFRDFSMFMDFSMSGDFSVYGASAYVAQERAYMARERAYVGRISIFSISKSRIQSQGPIS